MTIREPYIPILQSKIGELRALATISPLRKGEEIIPLITALKEERKTLVRELRAAWHDQPFYLDLNLVEPSKVGTLLSEFLAAGLTPIMVVRAGSAPELLDAAKSVIADRGKHACLRVDAGTLLAGDAERRLIYSLKTIGVAPKNTDVILDFGYIPDPRTHTANAVRALTFLPRFEDWRTITVAAGSIPEKIAELPYDEHGKGSGIWKALIPRPEIETYTAVRAEFSRTILFSDYTVTHPAPPIGNAAHRPTANLRYTLEDGFLILRGVHENGNEDVRRLCRALVKMPEYASMDHSPGDKALHDCASLAISTGDARAWRSWDVNHHIETTMDQLSSLCEP